MNTKLLFCGIGLAPLATAIVIPLCYSEQVAYLTGFGKTIKESLYPDGNLSSIDGDQIAKSIFDQFAFQTGSDQRIHFEPLIKNEQEGKTNMGSPEEAPSEEESKPYSTKSSEKFNSFKQFLENRCKEVFEQKALALKAEEDKYMKADKWCVKQVVQDSED